MAIPSRQIGGSTRSNLLWQISKQLEHLICVRSCGCGGNTTTSTSTTIIEPTTTTTTSYPIPIECIVYNVANGNIYIYDPLTNLSVEILTGGVNSYFQVANTDTKLWSSQAGGYINEFNIAFSPGPSVTYNRLINTGSVFVSGTFAIDNTTLIAGDASTLGIYELDITTTTSINTLKGAIEIGFLPTDMLLTTSGKLIIVATNPPISNVTKIYQYDYATWTLEINLDLTSQLPALNYAIGIAEYDNNIYIFTRIAECSINTTPSGVYILDPLTNNITLVNSTGLSCPSGASSWLPCNTQSLNPNITTTTTTTLSPEECVALILNNGNIYTYDINTNISVNRGTFFNVSDVANTATKMWFPANFIKEYNITVFPWSAAFNRDITYNTQLAIASGLCAKDNVTLITTNPSIGFPHPIVSLDITGSTAIETIIGYLPMNIFVSGDLVYTTTNKLIITGQNSINGNTYLLQYDFTTMNLEVQSQITASAPQPFGLMEANNNLYVLSYNGNVHEVDLNYPYTLTLVQNTGLNKTGGASQTPGCCNVNLIPQITTTTTTTLAPTGFNTIYTSFEVLTSTTTTTLPPTGFNTIYTHFESL